MNTPTRICPICKASVTPSERFCGNCGTPFPEPTAVDPTQMATPPPSPQPQQGQVLYNEAPPPYGATSYGANVPPPPNSGYNPTVPAYEAGSTPSYGPSAPNYEPAPPTPNYGPSSSPYNASGYGPSAPNYGPSAPNYEPTPAYNPSTPGYGPSSPSYNPSPSYTPSPATYPYQPGPQTPPKRSRSGLIVGIIVAVVVVVIAACGGTVFLISKITPTPTPSISNRSTVITNPTAAPTPTPTPKAQVLFSDNFANNNNNWNVGSDTGLSVTIDNNQMTLKEANQKRLDEQIPTNQSYGDFSLTANVTLVSGDSNDRAGFRFRASGDDLGYFVRIFGDDTYDIHKVYKDSSNQSQDIELVNVNSSSALHTQGQANVVQVIAKGSTIVLYFNGTKVQSVTDTAFTSGPIYLNAGNGTTSKGVIASFSNVELDAAPDTLP